VTAWMLARASGLVAYAMFSVATITGLLLSSKYLGKKASRNLTLVHEAGSIGGLLLVVLHAWAILNDAYFDFTLRSILLPGLSPYSPLWVGAGIIAGYISLVVVGSFYLRKKIGPRTWRRIHYSTFIAYVAMTTHGFMAGTDRTNALVLGMYSASLATTLGLLTYRISTSIGQRKVKEARKKAAHERARSKLASGDQSHAHAAVH
jgi:sulfoxide reductase heme-binding subunit YedZ